jgi:actin-related protein
MVESTNAIVIDNGSGVIKAGFSGSDQPHFIAPCILGRPKPGSVLIVPGGDDDAFYIGYSAQKIRGILQLEYPIEHGIVKNWDDMTLIWQDAIANGLRALADEHSLMITEPPLNPKNNRENMINVAFETLRVKSFYAGIQAVLAMISSGVVTGIVLDSGDGVTHAVPIYEGYSIPHAVIKIMLAGRDITKELEKLMTECGWFSESTAQTEIVREIKEKLCYVSMNFEEDLVAKENAFHAPKDETRIKEWRQKYQIEYELPDGNTLSLGTERFRAPEILFNPSLHGKSIPGIHKLVNKSIAECDVDTRKSLWENIILTGGSAMFEGYADRFRKEIKALAPTAINARVTTVRNPINAVFNGAAQLAGLPSFKDSWITKEEYEETGPGIIHRKCY